MITLLIDTATEYGVIALFDEDSILFKKVIPIGWNNSKILLKEIEDAFKMVNISAASLGCVAVGAGPGSYTGIRVGVVVAKTFAYVKKIPIVSFTSLDGFVPFEEGPFTSIIDAKISGAYVLFGVRANNRVIYTSIPAVRSLDSLYEDLKAHPILVSPKSSALKIKVETLYPNLGVKWVDTPPNIEQMVTVARESFKRGQFSHEGKVDILYLRKTQAEIERERYTEERMKF